MQRHKTMHRILHGIRSYPTGGSNTTVNFVYDVEAIEIVLFFNSIAWAMYFGRPKLVMQSIQFYVAMSHFAQAEIWYTAALLLLILQIITLIFRTYQLRRTVFALYAFATLFAQWALWHIPLIVLNEYQNLGIAVACVYGFSRLAIRHRTVRIA